MDIRYATKGARVAYFNGVSDEYGTVRTPSKNGTYVLVVFDGEIYSKPCFVDRLALVDSAEVEDTETMTSQTDDAFDPLVRHNRYKDFETESEGKILEDQEIWQRGFDDAMELVKDALITLKVYEELGEPHKIIMGARRGQVLMDYIEDQPAPIKQAWKKHLSEKKAL